MKHLWSGRFEAPPDAGLFAFGRSFPFDRRLLQDEVAGSTAWAAELARAGVIGREDRAAIESGLVAILREVSADPAALDGPDEDVHAFVERKLVERVGEAGKRLHTGRSRNEQVSLDLRLYLGRRIPLLQIAACRLVGSLASRASAAGEALMPAYTHMRRAQPVLAAHFFLAHAAAIRRDHHRLAAAADEADSMVLGSGAVAGTSYAIDTSSLARRLGFSRVAANSIDAASDRDFVSSFLHACSLAMIHLARLAEDLIVMSGEEHGFFELADRAATGSSLMPQKKNPDPLELVRGKAGRVAGRLAGWLTTMKGLPSGYNKDLQEDKEAVFDAEDTLAACLAACAAVVDGTELQRGRADRAASGLLVATDVAEYLVGRGVPFRDAHALVGAMVRRLVETNRTFADLSLDEWQAFSPRCEDDVRDVASARRSVEARRTPQSTGPAAVRAALEETLAWVATASSEGNSSPGAAGTG